MKAEFRERIISAAEVMQGQGYRVSIVADGFPERRRESIRVAKPSEIQRIEAPDSKSWWERVRLSTIVFAADINRSIIGLRQRRVFEVLD